MYGIYGVYLWCDAPFPVGGASDPTYGAPGHGWVSISSQSQIPNPTPILVIFTVFVQRCGACLQSPKKNSIRWIYYGFQIELYRPVL